MKIFNKEQQEKADFIKQNDYAKLSNINSTDIKKLGVIWSFYSGKIEGSTYTYAETDVLLTLGLTSPKRYEDAKMLKNLYNTFLSSIYQIKEKKEIISIDTKTILSLHSSLISGLIDPHETGNFRTSQVQISGTDYLPPADKSMIIYEFGNILNEQHTIKDPLEKAIYLHCNIARIQPFRDGNKRTSRLIESIVMMQNNIIPVYSNKQEEIVKYIDALLYFYETKNYTKYIDYSLNSQISRINLLNENQNKSLTNKKTNKLLETENPIKSKKKGFSI